MPSSKGMYGVLLFITEHRVDVCVLSGQFLVGGECLGNFYVCACGSGLWVPV